MAESESGADPNAGTLSDAARIQETFSRVMQKVKSAYTKELQRKKQVDLTSSVDIMRKNIDETNDSESNEDDEAMQAMSKVSSHNAESLLLFILKFNGFFLKTIIRFIMNDRK